jgi:outer membrane lipoprotein-sorting protein
MQLLAAMLLGALASSASALTVDELVSKNIEARGGIDAIRAIQSIKSSGRMNFSGGDFSIDLGFASLNERDAKVRIEASIQGLTQVTAFDGKEAWTINPFQGRRDPERMSAEDSKGLELQSDIDGPLVDWKQKGHQVEYLGTEDMDGTEAHKLKIALKNGDIQYRYLDPDYFLEILVVDQSKRRGVETEMETELGNYEKVAGVYMPFAMESGPKGGRRGQKITIEKAEANVDIDDSLFAFPQAAK